MIDPRQLPEPITVRPPREGPRWAVALLAWLAGAGGVVALVVLGLPLLLPAAAEPSGPRAEEMVATFPTELIAAANALSTMAAPTPTAIPATPEPTYSYLPTPVPVLCGIWLEVGAICEMPRGPKPSPTPLPECPVLPLQECRWMGSRSVTPVAPMAIRQGH